MEIEDIYNEDGKINMDVFFHFLKLIPEEFEKFKNNFVEGNEDFKKIKSYLFVEVNNKKTSKEKCDFLILALRQLTDLKLQYEARIHEKWTVVEKANNTPAKRPIFEKLISFCDDLLNTYTKLSRLEEKTTVMLSETKIPLFLFDIFESSSKYSFIMNLLIEKGHCQTGTHIWKDEGKGNKGLLVAILKHLHTQQYYKENKRPTAEEIKEIAHNTFGSDISIDTIKKTKPIQIEYSLTFIPSASTLS